MVTIGDIQKKYQAQKALDILLLLAFVLKKDTSFILAHPEFQLSPISYFLFRLLLRRRRRGVPLAYITGHKEFYGIDFLVNKHTLVPRPDTEVLVASVIEEIKNKKQEIILIDVGTGGGCIPIAVIKTLKYENFKTVAIDISKKALKVAKKNARIQNVSIEFLRGSLLEPVIETLKLTNGNSQIIITANLPYGWKEWKNESSMETKGLQFEPPEALFTGEHGLELIRKLLEQIKTLSNKTSGPITIFLEYDPRQTEMLTQLITTILPEARFEIKKDLAQHDRVAIVKIKKQP